jgi:hypothetical protein
MTEWRQLRTLKPTPTPTAHPTTTAAPTAAPTTAPTATPSLSHAQLLKARAAAQKSEDTFRAEEQKRLMGFKEEEKRLRRKEQEKRAKIQAANHFAKLELHMSHAPTGAPTWQPSSAPTTIPTASPSSAPTDLPTTLPTEQSKSVSTHAPTAVPTTRIVEQYNEKMRKKAGEDEINYEKEREALTFRGPHVEEKSFTVHRTSNSTSNSTGTTNISTSTSAIRATRGSRSVHDCAVSAWSPYDKCTKSCGNGHHKRVRIVTRHAEHGGYVCPHLKMRRNCNNQACPVNHLKPHSPLVRPAFHQITRHGPRRLQAKSQDGSSLLWSDCSHSCGSGVRARER